MDNEKSTITMDEISEIKYGLNRILSYLENDNKTGRDGLVTEVKNMNQRIGTLEQKFVTFIAEYRQEQAVKNAKVGLIGAIAGGLVTLIFYIIKIFW